MKILPGAQPAILAAETAENKTEQPAPATPKKAAPKPPRSADQVDFSLPLSEALKSRQELQAKRVESIKAAVKAGTYQVSSREVAQKMLDQFALFHHES
jgi:flagellar biosynthesis anti-sigma factor FlgM